MIKFNSQDIQESQQESFQNFGKDLSEIVEVIQNEVGTNCVR